MSKTIKIIDLIHKVNDMNKISTCSKDARSGWNSFLADIMHKSDVYAGFSYLDSNQVPKDCLPGIRWNNEGPDFSNTDETRIQWYVHRKLL